jgi:hypothetical protein
VISVAPMIADAIEQLMADGSLAELCVARVDRGAGVL